MQGCGEVKAFAGRPAPADAPQIREGFSALFPRETLLIPPSPHLQLRFGPFLHVPRPRFLLSQSFCFGACPALASLRSQPLPLLTPKYLPEPCPPS